MELVELFKQKFAGPATICPIVYEIVQNLAFTVLLFEQKGKKQLYFQSGQRQE